MSHIIIKGKEQRLSRKQLEELFLSVEWSSGHYPEKLEIAMQNYATVYTAWDDDTLVGLISAMDDGIMTAYIHYLLVRPDYQGTGIGKQLLDKVKDKYKDYLRITLISYNKECGFYEHQGFKKGTDETPMFITTLWT
ncbi:MAG: GNAT family N-acetyltransferase [Bacteroidaceae bacterium]